jgi:hypothetical protein
VAVVENQLHGVLADGLHPQDPDLGLAGHQDSLARAVALDLRGRGVHPQVLKGQLEGLTVVKGVDCNGYICDDLCAQAEIAAPASHGKYRRRARLNLEFQWREPFRMRFCSLCGQS